MPPPPRSSSSSQGRPTDAKGGTSNAAKDEKIKKVRRIMAEVALMLESFKASPIQGELSASNVFKLALFQAKTDLLRAKKDRLSSFRDIRAHMKLCEAADEYLKTNGYLGTMRTVVNQKWTELLSWSRSAEELIQVGMDKVGTVPGNFVGTEMPDRNEIQRLLNEVPAFRQRMWEESRKLLARVPEGVVANGQLDRNFESYLRFTERSSAIAVPRVTELLMTISVEDAANPILATVDRYASALSGLLQKHESHRLSLENAARLHREGSHTLASAAVTVIGMRFPDLDYRMMGEVKTLEATLNRLDRLEGKELALAAETLAARHPGLPEGSELAVKLARARERGLSKQSRSRLILCVLGLSSVLGVGLAVFAGIGLAKRSAQEEENRLARQAEQIKRTRSAEAEAEARRALMREESRKAELASLAQNSANSSGNPDHKEAEEFFQLNQGVPHRVNTAPAAAPVEMALNWIPAGNFLMGGPEADNDARLSSVILTKGFWLGRTEVTQSQWSGTMDSNPSEQIGPALPVEQVHWSEAVRFCRLLTDREQRAGRLPRGLAYTLPTEAQWEYACRASQEGKAPANLTEIAWSMDNSGGKTNPVGGLKANGWGLHDMFGNVSEWCLDWYGPYDGLNATDPSGPSEGRRRVNRGGSWLGTLNDYRYHRRDKDIPELRSKSIGFRVALVRQ